MPSALDEEAWRRRSAKRQSYTSQMTCGTIQANSRTSTVDPEKATGPFSQISSTSTTEQRRSRAPRRKHPGPNHDVYSDLHWDINPLDPRNWRKRKKHAHTLVAALVTFTVTLASSIIAPASSFLTSAYDTTSFTTILPTSVFLLGLAFGLFLSRTCSVVLGRRMIYALPVLLFAIFTLTCELVTTLPGLLISRLFAGILAGPALTQGSAMIAEMWKPEDRTAPLMFYFVAPLLGPVVGMVVGGYVRWSERDNWTRFVYGPRAKHWQAQRASETEKGRRVSIQGTQRGTTDNFSPTNVSPLVSNDSSTTLALSQRGSRPASERMKTAPAVDHARNACLAAAAAHYLHSVGVNHDIEIQPEQTSLLLSTNPAYSDLCAALESHHLQFNAVQPAKVLVEALPARQTSEGPTTPQRAALVRPKSSHFFAAAVRSDEAATRLAPPSASRHVAFYVSTTDPQTQSATSTGPTEQHLHPALPASILLVASLFLIGWTTREDIHWIVPCIGMALLAFAALLTFVSIELHTADRFGESESASAGDGVLVVRYLMCAGFTMAAVPIYECLGVRWVTSMFGFMGVVVGVCPWVLVFAGGGRRDDGS
ncbi:hypothetical protein LTR73_001284 [Friedmanniomyces endolithicus]|nr:hypothetical protein LTR73_001284 [Friedmanniomyces endolithicus]